MTPSPRRRPRLLAATLLGLLSTIGCFDEPPVETGLTVFDDAFHTGFTPNPFENSLTTALGIDENRAHSGSASIRLDVPALPAYTGGAVLAAEPQDLSRTTALTFWIQGSRETSFDELGFGLNFDPDPSPYRSAVFDLPVTAQWTQHVVPLADPSLVTADKGMLYYVDTEQTAFTAWLDDVRFDVVDLALEPSMASATSTVVVGAQVPVPGLTLAYTDLDGTVREVDSSGKGSGPAPAFFRFASSDEAVATVDADGRVTAVGVGTATITAELAGAQIPGTFTVEVVDSLPTEPVAPPAAPTADPATVISLFSEAYTSVPVDTWLTTWSTATLEDVTVAGEPVKKYGALDVAGVEFTGSNLVDAGAMGFLHVDVWTPDATGLSVKLVDFGANGAYDGGGDDTEHTWSFDAGSSPALAASQWVGLELPLSDLPQRAHLAQLLFIGAPSGSPTLYVDNVYFHE